LVQLPEGSFVIENCWPIPDTGRAARGVVVQGPVASRRMARWRVFRYEVRRWRDGIIADVDAAVASPQLLSDDPDVARRLLELVGSLPRPVWGRDELRTGEMWNSNSVTAWLLARSGLPMEAIRPPAGGRAPGWEAGLVMARRHQASDDRAWHTSRITLGRQLRPGELDPNPRALAGAAVDLDPSAERLGPRTQVRVDPWPSSSTSRTTAPPSRYSETGRWSPGRGG
jgi:hypothetical protein